LLIPLFLQQKQVLGSPTFYLSEYLEQYRETYYARLLGISQRGEWNAWIEFFLTAVVQQAKRNTEKVRQTLALYEQMKAEIAEATHSQHAIHLLDAIFDRPVFQTSDIVKRTELPKQTLMPLLRKLKDAGTLTTIREASGRRPAILAFPKLLAITEGKQVLA
jgi:Fic family protein